MVLYTMKFYLLNHRVKYMGRFGALKIPESSGLGHSDVLVKRAYQATSKRYSSKVEIVIHLIKTRRAN